MVSSLGAVILVTTATVAVMFASISGVDIPAYLAPLILVLIPAGWVLDDYMGWSGGAF